VALAMVDRLAPPGVIWGDMWRWLGATPPEEAMIAFAAVAVRLAAVWVLVSTTVTGLAMLSGRARVTETASRFALPAVRRLALATATRLAAVTLAVTPALAPVTATSLEATPPSSVRAWAADEPDHPLPPFLVIAPGGGELPAAVDDSETTAEDATTDTRPMPIPPFLLTEGGTVAPVDTPPVTAAIGTDATRYTVVAGDHLWAIAGKRLTEVRGQTPDEDEHARYWVRLVDANRGRVRSGDPDLIFAGEVIELPEIEPASG
jgi:nucleoid-associated protein YgaU